MGLGLSQLVRLGEGTLSVGGHAAETRRCAGNPSMSTKHEVVFYPVGNGDSVQIILAQGRRVLFDFCHRDKGEDANAPEIDLKARLREELRAVGRDDFDVVAFTHADNDHIQGSTTFFELGYAECYQGGDRVKSGSCGCRRPCCSRKRSATSCRTSSSSCGRKRDTACSKARASWSFPNLRR